jgi:hypothetical protein
MREVVVAGNSFKQGSAVFAAAGLMLVLESCSIVENSGGWPAGGFLPSAQQPVIPQWGAGLLCAGMGNCTLHNTLIWDSSPGTAPRVVDGSAMLNVKSEILIAATYSNIKGGALLPGAGNLAADPQLQAGPSFVPAGGSPMVDAGDPDASTNTDTLDFASAARVQRGRQDIGALEAANIAPELGANFSTTIGLGRRQVLGSDGRRGGSGGEGKG